MKQLRSVDAAFLYSAAFRATTQLVGPRVFDPRGNFGEFLFERVRDNPTACMSHSPRAGHDSEGVRLPERHSRRHRHRRSIAARTASGVPRKAVAPRRGLGAALPRYEAMRSRK
jgi:hypothetical protein